MATGIDITESSNIHDHSNVECVECGLDFDFELPFELIKAAHMREVVIFAGAGISTEVPAVHPVTIFDAATEKIGRTDLTSFPDVMQAFVDQFDKTELVQMIKKKFDYIDSFRTLRLHARKFHRELATMPYLEDIVTTNWDTYFEEESDATPFISGEDIALWKMDGRKVLKIHGSISSPASIVATEDDYKRQLEALKTNTMGTFLKNFLITKTVVFVGYSLRDWNFRRLYGDLLQDMGEYAPRAYFVSPFDVDPDDQQRFRLKPLKTSGVKFLRDLKHANYSVCFINDSSYDRVHSYLLDINKADAVAKSVSHKEYPSVVYCWAFHDGVRDACCRILIRRTSGEYSSRQFVWDRINTYEMLADNASNDQRYWDEAYIAGYLVPLMIMVDDNEAATGTNILKSASRYFVYGNDNNLQTADDFRAAIELSRRRAPKERKVARKIAEGIPVGMVLEHEPFLPGLPTENDPIPNEHED